MVFVIKANGEKEVFDKKKIVRTVKRAGVDEKTSRKIANRVAATVRDGEKTHNIYKRILRELNKLESKAPFNYRLREAVAQLGPMVFERYIKKILEFYGFKCQLDKIIKGEFVEHEIDVVAQKNGKTILVECKRHVNPHRFTALGVVLSLWARMEDINRNKSGRYKFNNAWIVTNTKISEHALRYAKGKGMYFSAWNIGGEYSLEKLITKDKLYPITVLKADERTLDKLVDNDILTIGDLLNAKTLPVQASKAQNLIEQMQKLVSKPI